MQRISFALLTAASLCALGSLVAPAHAQTFAPPYPVCLHVYGRITYYECAYTSLPQCNASASGRPAQCVVNPYLAGAAFGDPPPRRHWRHRYVY
jgi:Protein of unknown function (DUF3551)